MLEFVASLPRRIAHVTHALIESSGPYAYGQGLRTTAEVLVYDSESLSQQATYGALIRAVRRGLVDRTVGLDDGVWHSLWLPTSLALDHRRALEDRFLADTKEDRDA
jgi:hypothetical protein